MRTLFAFLPGLAVASVLTGALWAVAPAEGLAQPQSPGASLPDFTELVERVGPAVVNIRTAERVRANPAAEIDPQMQEFLRRFGLPVPRRGPPRGGDEDEAPQRRGVGSGFVVSAETHAIDAERQIRLLLSKGTHESPVAVAVHPEVAEYLKADGNAALSDIEEDLGVSIALEADGSMAPGSARIAGAQPGSGSGRSRSRSRSRAKAEATAE